MNAVRHRLLILAALPLLAALGCATVRPGPDRASEIPRSPVPEVATGTDVRTIPEVPPPRPGTAIVAIVIDDCGESIEQIVPFLGIPVPLTFGILPYQAEATATSRTLARSGQETLVHMPMEPNDPKWLENDWFLRTGMKAADLEKRLELAFQAVPTATGMNNHMGSKVCADADAMAAVMNWVGARGLYYLDSRTTRESKAIEAARAAGIRYLSRDVFLDNDDDVTMIGRQIEALVAQAKLKGCALGIGHARSKTAAAIMNYVRVRDPAVVFVPAGRFFDYCPASVRTQTRPE